ncbi:MAG TPA: AraC family transcriptional regulator [Mucilaginibacter sp.]|jgi:AraC-like DNA-binding protein|nr:AraC family transcriptional regulator [Mucilaginibacter sp.]
MLLQKIVREVTPLTSGDCFSVSSREIKEFDNLLHYHDEYELMLVSNAKGAKRVVGNSVEVIDDLDLVFVGPNVYHSWFTHQNNSGLIKEISIKFDKDLFDESFLKRDQLCLVKGMLNNAQRGILFSKETTINVVERIINLKQKTLFDAVLEVLSILHALSTSPDTRLLSTPGFFNEKFSYKSRRIERVFEYLSSNYEKNVKLEQAANIANMPPASFSRFFKKMTGKTYIDSLNEIRLGHASRMLADTDLNIANIAYKCGFNNISNFNRTFKRKKLCIPREFREIYTSEKKVYI